MILSESLSQFNFGQISFGQRHKSAHDNDTIITSYPCINFIIYHHYKEVRCCYICHHNNIIGKLKGTQSYVSAIQHWTSTYPYLI